MRTRGGPRSRTREVQATSMNSAVTLGMSSFPWIGRRAALVTVLFAPGTAATSPENLRRFLNSSGKSSLTATTAAAIQKLQRQCYTSQHTSCSTLQPRHYKQ